jgi:serine/threonine protein kinase
MSAVAPSIDARLMIHEISEFDVVTQRFGADAMQPASIRKATPGLLLADRYVIKIVLGSGGMGSVYKAVDLVRRENPEIDCHVAIKILHEETRWQPKVLARLGREFYCAQSLAHRSVIKVFELHRDDEFAFFTMELLQGELLSELTNRSNPTMSRATAWSLIQEIGEGVAHAHSRNVVHADLKPQNIMLTKSGEVRILDFGASSDSTAATPAYASCELLDGAQADPRDDLFSLACLSYELLAGEHPFQHRRSSEARHLGLTPDRPTGLTRRQWQALSLGLRWDREDRDLSVRDWLLELEPTAPGRQEILIRTFAVATAAAVCLAAWGFWHRPPISLSTAERDSVRPAIAATPVAAAPAVLVALPEVPAAVSADSVASKAAHKRTLNEAVASMGLVRAAYRILPTANFAEIKVRRSPGLSDTSGFSWWTESDSAIANVDFVPQPRTTMFFLPGRRIATLFVKLVPNPTRQQSRMFYVIIANPGSDASLALSRAGVSLLASKERGSTPHGRRS